MPENTGDNRSRLVRLRNEALSRLRELARDKAAADDCLADFWALDRAIEDFDHRTKDAGPGIDDRTMIREAIRDVLRKAPTGLPREEVVRLAVERGVRGARNNSPATRVRKSLGYYLDNPQGRALNVIRERDGLVLLVEPIPEN